MSEGLSEVAFTGTAGADDKNRYLLLDEVTGGKIHDESLVDVRIEGKVKIFNALVISEICPPQGESESFLSPSGDFILDDHGEEIRIGEFVFYGLAVSLFKGIEDSG